MKITKFNWQEPTAYSFVFIALIFGLYYGMSYQHEFLSSSGAAIIVCGVLLASSRKIYLIKLKMDSYFYPNLDNEIKKLITQLKSEGEEFKGKEKSNSILMREDIIKNYESFFDHQKALFKRHEIFIIILGTLINGFSPFIITSLKKAFYCLHICL